MFDRLWNWLLRSKSVSVEMSSLPRREPNKRSPNPLRREILSPQHPLRMLLARTYRPRQAFDWPNLTLARELPSLGYKIQSMSPFLTAACRVGIVERIGRGKFRYHGEPTATTANVETTNPITSDQLRSADVFEWICQSGREGVTTEVIAARARLGVPQAAGALGNLTKQDKIIKIIANGETRYFARSILDALTAPQPKHQARAPASSIEQVVREILADGSNHGFEEICIAAFRCDVLGHDVVTALGKLIKGGEVVRFRAGNDWLYSKAVSRLQ